MSKDTITVACKLPAGLNLGPAQEGGRDVILRGAHHGSAMVAGGFGLTPVPAAFWEKWVEDHKDFDPVKKGLIFASAKSAHTVATAREMAEVETGFEQLDPDKAAPEGIEPTDESAKERAKTKGRRAEAADAAKEADPTGEEAAHEG